MENSAATGDFEQMLRDMIGLSTETVGASVIRHALTRRMTACGLPSLDAYRSYLAGNKSERQELIDTVIVPETWFFRDREAFAAMVRHARETKLTDRPIRLLSLPCSTGEEPYSMAMALFDAGFGPTDFAIDAFDVSSRNLALAGRAIYGKNSFRGSDLSFRERYFEALEGGFRPHEIVRRPVRFSLGNVLDPTRPMEREAYDIIFCRNLLIYFDRETQASALAALRQALSGKGLLLVGPGESGLPSLHGFTSARLPRAFAFTKEAPTPGATARSRSEANAPAIRKLPASTASSAPPKPKPRPFASRATMAPSAPASSPESEAAGLAAIESAANAGRLAEARAAAERHIAAFGPSAEVFYLLGLAQDADDAEEDAAGNYRKALYLAPDHRQALAHLRLLLQRRGDEAGARALADRLDRLTKRSGA
ncbi:CheR family methyltransferase [Bosea sp. NBC_00550]|uniref:CheR family methyltransferase n=1 Tax=Bosea sp. NBC_00550 TaxID=2969621 RepID=UPI00222EAE70|nr:CheR family methyltransferase [Bosea sp. NBC_00550]UZF92159.1 methyltransferase [Bosea sp. NBC_00550]